MIQLFVSSPVHPMHWRSGTKRSREIWLQDLPEHGNHYSNGAQVQSTVLNVLSFFFKILFIVAQWVGCLLTKGKVTSLIPGQTNGKRGRKRGRETSMCKRNINLLPLARPQLGTWPTTQACALTGNRTSGLSVCRQCPSHWTTLVRAECSFFTRQSYLEGKARGRSPGTAG